MAYQICVALTTEGTTDINFLQNIVENLFVQIAFDHVRSETECIVNVVGVKKTGLSFAENVKEAAKEAHDIFGATTLAVHTDADKMTYDERRENNIAAAEAALQGLSSDEYCLLLTPVIPVRMIEAWMLADKDLLRSEFGTRLTDAQLGIDGNPEDMADPKAKIEDAIRIAKTQATHKNKANDVDISDLYAILGQKIPISKLETLSSFQRFEGEILETLTKLGLPIIS